MASLEGLKLLMSYFKFFFWPIPAFLQVGLG